MRRPVIGITADADEEIFRLKRHYVSAIAGAGAIPVIIPHGADDAAGVADAIDGLLFSGGGDIPPGYYGEALSVSPECMKFVREERTGFELSLLREAMERKKPVLGICLGMQLINVALGGSLYQDIGRQAPDASDHMHGEHPIAVERSFLSNFNLQPASFVVNSFHHQAVKSPGAGLRVFASAGDGIVEGIWKDDYPFLVGVQWHPEREPAFLLKPPACDTLSLKIFEVFIEKAGEFRKNS